MTITKPTNEQKIISYLLNSENGFSEHEGVFELNFTSGRNYINKLEQKLQISFKREWEKTQDGENKYYRYSLADRHSAEKLIQYFNMRYSQKDPNSYISENARNQILKRFNDVSVDCLANTLNEAKWRDLTD